MAFLKLLFDRDSFMILQTLYPSTSRIVGSTTFFKTWDTLMKHMSAIIILITCLTATGSVLDPVGTQKTNLKLASAENATYQIVFSSGDSDGIEAANKLASILKKISSGVSFKVVNDSSQLSGNFISIGHTHQAKTAGIGKSLPAGKSAFEIKVLDKNIYLLGSVTNFDAIMGFLEGGSQVSFFYSRTSVFYR